MHSQGHTFACPAQDAQLRGQSDVAFGTHSLLEPLRIDLLDGVVVEHQWMFASICFPPVVLLSTHDRAGGRAASHRLRKGSVDHVVLRAAGCCVHRLWPSRASEAAEPRALWSACAYAATAGCGTVVSWPTQMVRRTNRRTQPPGHCHLAASHPRNVSCCSRAPHRSPAWPPAS